MALIQDNNPLETGTNQRILSSQFHPSKSIFFSPMTGDRDIYLLVYSEGEIRHCMQSAFCNGGSRIHAIKQRAEWPREKFKHCVPADMCLNPCSANIFEI